MGIVSEWGWWYGGRSSQAYEDYVEKELHGPLDNVHQRTLFRAHVYGVAAGISASGIYLGSREFLWLPFVCAFTGIFLFFVFVRLMDEVKGLEKDRIAHPQRPLPRGLISKHEAVHILELLQMILFAYSLVLWVFLQAGASLAFLAITVYLWLMNKEFGIGHWLKSRPFLYGLTHQLILFPVAFFALAVVRQDVLAFPLAWSFAMLLFGAFFCYEICRILNPHTHPILGTYIHYYGFRRTFEFSAFMLALSSMGALALKVAPLLVPCEFFLLAGLSVLFFQPALFRIPEYIASISLILHVWAVALFRIF